LSGLPQSEVQELQGRADAQSLRAEAAELCKQAQTAVAQAQQQRSLSVSAHSTAAVHKLGSSSSSGSNGSSSSAHEHNKHNSGNGHSRRADSSSSASEGDAEHGAADAGVQVRGLCLLTYEIINAMCCIQLQQQRMLLARA
jgi:hypothetical protein